MSYIILNKQEYADFLIQKYGINKKKIIINSAFIPPLQDEFSEIPQEIVSFREKHDFLISANGWKLIIRNGVDLYGLDLLIELIHILKQKGYNAGLIFGLPQTGDYQYFLKIKNKITDLKLDDHILIWQETYPPGFEIWRLSDLFIRPTITDIEGISIKEALSVGTNVIASDVCPRPSQAVIFENRNLEQLTQLTESILNKPPLIRFKEENGLNKIWQCYQSV